MKKILTMFTIILAIILTHIVVFADMGAPMISPYEAYVSNVEGASYKEFENGQYIEKKLEYGTKILVNYEAELDDGMMYAYFTSNDIDGSDIKISDITPLEEVKSTKNVDFENPRTLKILADDGLEIYKGPASAYSGTGIIIPKNTEVVGYVEGTFYSDNPWYYVTYNGTSGWICELNGAIGYKSEFVEKIITPSDMKIYKDTTKQIPIGEIPANTIIYEILAVDAWSWSYYITYEGVSGYIDSMECGTYYPSTVTVNYNNAKLYKEGDLLNSEVLIESIPKGTVLEYEFCSDIRATGWIYTTYQNVKGWFFYAEEEMYYENTLETLKEEQNHALKNEVVNENILNKTENIISNSVLEEQIATNIVLNENIENEDANKSIQISVMQIVIMCMFIAVIIFLTSFVTVILVNKKYKTKQEDINNQK